MKKIVRIDMSSLNVSEEKIADDLRFLGGRGLTARIILNEVDPRAHALSKDNKLILAPGLFSSTTIPCTSRLSVGGKSPLTGGIKESNVGGPVSQKLARLGIGAIVIQGQPKSGSYYIINVTSSGRVDLEAAKDIQGKGNYETVQELFKMYGEGVSILSIGPAGEMLLPTATVAATDRDGFPSRHAGRGGMGAVMGSKGIKAIVIEGRTNDEKTEPVDKNLLKDCIKEFSEMVLKLNKAYKQYGTTSLVNFINRSQGLPTRNFSRGTFDGAEKISGERITEIIKERGGKTAHSCYHGCIIKCSHVFNDKEGNHITSKLEYETVGMLGANLEIDDVDTIAKMDRLSSDIGIDTIEVGATVGVLMETGYVPFGDGQEVISLLGEIKNGTPLGRLIGSGCEIVGKAFGCRRVPVVKGQALPCYDPRALQGMGVTFATSPMGADHTAGPVLPGMGKLDAKRPEGQVEFSKKVQTYCAILDNFGLCLFVSPSPKTMGFITKAIKALYGETISENELFEIGKEILRMEFKFNEGAGLKGVDDLPLFFRQEPLPEVGSSFGVKSEELRSIKTYFVGI
ncbi:MAG: aldehyde ferredoxin oxidoreductase [Deltaproteobacteria bacterium]|nr:aldehyde ferredoxin oxidoreductase [Deltaproteobacteria bacterium]MBW2025445.1 aldehyde ferredoxin oxidoreductase [Deltaproteobacteria bacterium]MBW2126898.1 aldehyde ferredoxin oxidoreductase [Deltaproteobacteria bacterium]